MYALKHSLRVCFANNDMSAAGEKEPDFCADAGSCFSGD